MHFVYQHQVCDCGSHSVYQHHQVQAQGRWTTLAEREADPTLVPDPIQSLAFISDLTWYTCSDCDARINAEQAQAWYSQMMAGKSWDSIPVIEHVGLGVFNPRGLTRLRINR